MKFINIDFKGKVNNDEPHFARGTGLVDYLSVSYKKLVSVFGEPNAENDGYKTDAEWVIFTPAGIATIYNYKTGKNYLKDAGTPIDEITDWHIGGRNKGVVKWLKLALGLE
jgi:hypothetical protein